MLCPDAHVWPELGRFLSKGKGIKHIHLGGRMHLAYYMW